MFQLATEEALKTIIYKYTLYQVYFKEIYGPRHFQIHIGWLFMNDAIFFQLNCAGFTVGAFLSEPFLRSCADDVKRPG